MKQLFKIMLLTTLYVILFRITQIKKEMKSIYNSYKKYEWCKKYFREKLFDTKRYVM